MKQAFFIIIVLFASCEVDEVKPCCSCDKIVRPDDTYEYPFKPGTPEWEAIKVGEQLNACQIPDSILTKISDQGLFTSCLEFPLFPQIMTHTSIQFGMDYFMKNFNGMIELPKRENVGSQALEHYKLMKISCYDTLPDDSSGLRGGYAFKFTYIEMLIAQPSILSAMDQATLRDLFNETVVKYQQKIDHKDLYAILGLRTTSYLMLHIMINKNYSPIINEIEGNDFLRHFSETVELQGHNEILDIIYNHSLKFKILI